MTKLNEHFEGFWKVPKFRISSLLDALDLIAPGYEVSEIHESTQKIFSREIRDNHGSLRSRECLIGIVCHLGEGDVGISIFYDSHNWDFYQIQQALSFRDILDANDVEYSESPRRNRIVSHAKNMVTWYSNFATRLETGERKGMSVSGQPDNKELEFPAQYFIKEDEGVKNEEVKDDEE